jgi:uncharacterized protein
VDSHEADLVRALFARLSGRDFEALVASLSDDVEFDLAYAPEFLPMPTRGRDAVGELVVNVIGGMFEPFTIEVVDTYPGVEPGLVVAEYRSDGTVKHNGQRYENRYVGIFRFRDDQLAFWREYHNPEQATKAMTG